MTIQPLICNSCGGSVDRDTLTCKSCGIQYIQDCNPRRQELTTYGRLRVMNSKSNIDYIRNISGV